MPIFIRREERGGRMHSTNGPSIRFKDGYEIYNLWGVEFDRDLYWRIVRNEMPAKDVFKIENIEQRMAALKFLGTEKVLEACDSKLIDSQVDSGTKYDLYQVDGLTEETEYALKYKCPSTGREYVSFVRPEVGKEKDAIKAIASKWRMSKEEWSQIGAHS